MLERGPKQPTGGAGTIDCEAADSTQRQYKRRVPVRYLAC